MRSGKRRCYIKIEKPAQVKQPNGSMLTTWTEFISLWASIETLKAYEKEALAASWPEASQKVTFRYVDGILPTMRIVFNNMIYSVLGINNVDMRNRDLIITTKSGVSAI